MTTVGPGHGSAALMHVDPGHGGGLAVFLVRIAVIRFFGFGLGATAAREQATFVLTAPPAVTVSPLHMSVRWCASRWRSAAPPSA